MTRPSWQDFGTFDESAYPELWDGVVGAWCPSLGPTGLRLHDHSRRSNWGTLTNMDAATDWTLSGGQYALDFDGVNDVVTASSAGFALAAPFTISVWYNPRTRKAYAGIVSTMTAFDETSTNGWLVYDGAASNAGNIGLICGGTLLFTGSGNSTLNTWQHYVAVVNGTRSKIYKNAVVVASGTTGAPSYASTPAIKIGSFIASNGPSDSLIDDVALFRREVTPPEIQQLYQLGRGGMYERRRRTLRRVAIEQVTGARRRRILCGDYS